MHKLILAAGATLVTSLALTLTLTLGATGAFAQDTAKPNPPMKMDEPMPGEMKKPGMKQGDVKKAADDKQKKMKPMMDKEEQAMPAGAVGAKK